MKTITLCAGTGSRLRPLTNKMPKCLVPFEGRSILSRQLSTFHKVNLTNNFVMTGYLAECIKLPVQKIHNPNFSRTNMVYSLALAKELFDGSEDIIMSYGDIIFRQEVIERLISEDDEIVVVADLNWEKYWAERFDNYWHDVESFSEDQSGYIQSIGQVWTEKSEIQAQYIGLVKFSKEIQITIANQLNRIIDQIEMHNMYMTDFLQELISSGHKVTPMYIHSGWLEFDQHTDLDPKFLMFLNE